MAKKTCVVVVVVVVVVVGFLFVCILSLLMRNAMPLCLCSPLSRPASGAR